MVSREGVDDTCNLGISAQNNEGEAETESVGVSDLDTLNFRRAWLRYEERFGT